MKSTATYIAPVIIVTSTKMTARMMTPTWQASNTSTRSAFGFTTGSSMKVDKICESFISIGVRSRLLPHDLQPTR